MPFRPALPVLFALALLAAGCGGNAPDSGSAEDQGTDTASLDTAATPVVPLADFALQDYEGDVVLLNFWATWCAPCRAEMPDLVQLQKDLGAQGLQIIGVADRQGKDEVAPYLARQPVNYPIVTDPEGEIGERYGGIAALPTTLVIERDGTVRRRIVGRVRADQLRGQLEDVLASSGPDDRPADSSTTKRNSARERLPFIKSAVTLPLLPRRSPGGSARARS